MSFDTFGYLGRATSRAKSDVANKLVSMFLHEISRRVCHRINFAVGDLKYRSAVFETFGNFCCYCGVGLEHDRAAVEHPDAMNRFRVGLHIPGNVVVSCSKCNREKRRDDSDVESKLADSGWESFLSHDFSRCPPTCNTCLYWQVFSKTRDDQSNRLRSAKLKMTAFRERHSEYLTINARIRNSLAASAQAIYRDCQSFAESRIKESVELAFRGIE